MAGVSVGTVSNVLNRPDFVSESTRQRVLDAMNELGFVRNATARQLRAGHSQTVGVVVLDLANPFYTGIVRGIEDRLAEDNHLLMLCSSDENEDRETRYLRQFAEQGVRGILITPFGNLNERFDLLTNLQIPVVLLDTHSPDLACVSVDNVKGGRLAVAHLLEQGHRRIALLNGPMEIQQCRDRSAGTRAAVYEAGLGPADGTNEVLLPHMAGDERRGGGGQPAGSGGSERRRGGGRRLLPSWTVGEEWGFANQWRGNSSAGMPRMRAGVSTSC